MLFTIRRIKLYTLVIMVAGISLVYTQSLFAQTSITSGLNEPNIDVIVSNPNPKPGDTVLFDLQSNSVDLERATVGWYVDGSLKKSGQAQKAFSVKVGAPGSATTVRVVVQPQIGLTFSKDTVLRPSSIDILWQSDSYTPPFYKGKPLNPVKASIKFIAIPHLVSGGSEINPNNLIYIWKKNGTVQTNGSGYGKSSFAPFPENSDILGEPYKISVEVSSMDHTLTGSESINVQSRNSGVLLYEDSPLYGVLFNNALSNQINLTSDEINITAYPYFYNNNDIAAGRVSYTWSMNGASIPNTGSLKSITLRNEDKVGGTSVVQVGIRNLQNVLQSAERSVSINFGQKNEASSF